MMVMTMEANIGDGDRGNDANVGKKCALVILNFFNIEGPLFAYGPPISGDGSVWPGT
jgi:hypothetical protein